MDYIKIKHTISIETVKHFVAMRLYLVRLNILLMVVLFTNEWTYNVSAFECISGFVNRLKISFSRKIFNK